MTASPRKRTAIIIGAGPGGLTAAYELLEKTDIRPVIFEMSEALGGLSRTVLYRGNRIDIGGHRFFSKHRPIIDWWRNILPLASGTTATCSRGTEFPPGCAGGPTADPEKNDKVMLLRRRRSSILFRHCLIPYPLIISIRTVRCLGITLTARIFLDYVLARLFPLTTERTLEDFFINRFGRLLYELFFRDFTEKVWGTPCSALPPDWGAQRVRGLSFWKALSHAVKIFAGITASDEVTLAGHFLYPKLGPGQLWEEVARRVVAGGCEIHLGRRVVGVSSQENRVTAVLVRDEKSGEEQWIGGDFFFSTMPIQDLVAGWHDKVPEAVREVASGLAYRDFITVGVQLSRLHTPSATREKRTGISLGDNWIYIQENGVKVGRLQIFNNWSPALVYDPQTFWVGMEYFCQENDEFWRLPDRDIAGLACRELVLLGFTGQEDILDTTVIRAPKAYPAYSGSYPRFSVIRDFLERFDNFFPIGRNGMHRYNNMDHSMLTAMRAVESIVQGTQVKDSLWAVNLEADYQG